MLTTLLASVSDERVLATLLDGRHVREIRGLPSEENLYGDVLTLGVSPSGERACVAIGRRLYLIDGRRSKVIRIVGRPVGPFTQWIRFSPDGLRLAVGDGYEQRVYSTEGLRLLLSRERMGYSFWLGKSLLGFRDDQNDVPNNLTTLLGPRRRLAIPKGLFAVSGTSDGQLLLLAKKRWVGRDFCFDLAAFELKGKAFERCTAWVTTPSEYLEVGSFVSTRDRFGRYVVGIGGVGTSKHMVDPHVVSLERELPLNISVELGHPKNEFAFWQPGFVNRNGLIGGFVRIVTDMPGGPFERTVFVSVGANKVYWKKSPYVYAVAQSKRDTWVLYRKGSRLALMRTWK